jgi:hypothetical protein
LIIKTFKMAIPTSAKFLQAWVEAVDSNKDILLKEWRHASTFTNLIKSNDDCILKQVADKLNLKCYPHDYYSIDSILYDDNDLVPNIPENSFWFRQVKVAFEHENDFKSGLYKEVSHLLLTNSDLKVLVTYPSFEVHEEQTFTEMKYLHNIIKGSSSQKELSDQESFLLIFGSEAGFVWDAFVFKEEEWKRIR